MTTERAEHRATQKALQQLYVFSQQPDREGISFTISRLTNDIFTTSFLGGGDCTPFTPEGHRGILTAQETTGNVLDSGGGAPSSFPINLTIDLNNGQVNASWTLPDGTAESPSFVLELYESIPTEQELVFYSDQSSDQAAYAMNLTLFP